MATQKAFFKPVAGSDKNRKKIDNFLHVENPEGDGRYNIDLSVNTENAKQAYFNEQLKEEAAKISILNKQVGKIKKPEDEKNLTMYHHKKIELEKKLTMYHHRKIELGKKLTAFESQKKYYLLKISEYCAEINMDWIRKRSYEFVEILASHFLYLIQDNIIQIDDLKEISLKKLALITHKTWIELLNNDDGIWPEILSLSLDELQGMAESNISVALDKRGYSFENLRKLFHEDKEMYSYATCENLEKLVFEKIPYVPEKLIQYTEENGEDIDWNEISDNLDGIEKTMFEMNLENHFEKIQKIKRTM